MRHFFTFFVVGFFCLIPLTAQAKVNILACEPEWASLAEEIGGERVKTLSATNAHQDPHYIRARPGLLNKARRADLLLCSGAGLEIGWLPLLLQKASRQVQPGASGYLMAADFVPLLEKLDVADRSMGDVHPEGNPHVHLNPHNILLVAQELTKRLEHIDSGHAGEYRERYEDFSKRWQQSIAQWEAEAASLKGKSVIVHHKAFTYLLDWLGMMSVASLEPKPGIPPTGSHLEGLLQQIKDRPVVAVLRTPYDPGDASQWLSEKTGTPALILPYTVGGDKQVGDLFALFDNSINLLKEGQDDQQ